MSVFKKSKFWIKLLNWEYWPFQIVYIPYFVYYSFLSIRFRSPFWISLTNPSIETGGYFFESKKEVFDLIPKQYYPKTLFISKGSKIKEINGFSFPIVAKPDRGERGNGVKIIKNIKELQDYSVAYPIDFLVQEKIDYPLEISVFYVRYPSLESGFITSITLKEYLSVTGDGIKNLKELIEESPRALIQKEKLFSIYKNELENIIQKNKKIELVSIGNHSKGATFWDCNDKITRKLTEIFDKISKQIDGFYYGRFDLKCESFDDLENGKNFSILELNGAGAEPAHIYNPNFSFWKGQKVLLSHLNYAFRVAKENKNRGYKALKWKEFKTILTKAKAHNRILEA